MSQVGHIDHVDRFFVSGWAGDTASPATSVTVSIFVDGQFAGSVKTDELRDGLGAVGLDDSVPHGFVFKFQAPLSPYKAFKITARTNVESGDLPPGVVYTSMLADQRSVRGERPLSGVLVAALTPSDARLVNELIARHPDVIGGRGAASEGGIAAYYSELFAMAAEDVLYDGSLANAYRHGERAGDVTSSGAFFPGRWGAAFDDVSFYSSFRTDQLFNSLAPAFRGIILDYYRALALHKSVYNPLLFVEPARLERKILEAAQGIMPRLMNVIVVRDVRDAFCALSARGGPRSADLALEELTAAASETLNLKRSLNRDFKFVRFEALSEAPRAAAEMVVEAVGLSSSRLPALSTEGSHDPETDLGRLDFSDVGRWRNDLDDLRPFQSGILLDYLEEFGYIVRDALADAERAASFGDLQKDEADAEVIPDAQLVERFESLGENCEFGLVQRRAGAEPLGLLRFSSAPLPKLIRALEGRFEGLGKPEAISIEVSQAGTEYMVLDHVYGFLYHAWAKIGELPVEDIHRREVRRLPFLVRKLLSDLEEGEKIFVFHAMERVDMTGPRRLSEAMKAFGHSQLLWVDVGDDDHKPGSVVRAGDNLLMGYVDRFAPGADAHDFSFASWMEVCRAASRLVRS